MHRAKNVNAVLQRFLEDVFVLRDCLYQQGIL
jgi:hypothetical protein